MIGLIGENRGKTSSRVKNNQGVKRFFQPKQKRRQSAARQVMVISATMHSATMHMPTSLCFSVVKAGKSRDAKRMPGFQKSSNRFTGSIAVRVIWMAVKPVRHAIAVTIMVEAVRYAVMILVMTIAAMPIWPLMPWGIAF